MTVFPENVRIILLALLSATGMTACGGGSDTVPLSNNTSPGNPPPTNSAPVISGNPATTVMVGQDYLFIPDASDSDDDTLTFAITNLPVWASFDSSTGQLNGHLGQGDEGVYSNIQISVSDDEATASLPVFSISVNLTATGSITMTWTPPTTNTDGTQLTNLASYKFYYGTSDRTYTESVQVNNPGVSRYVIENLLPDMYYIVATTINTDGIESDFSNQATAVVEAPN